MKHTFRRLTAVTAAAITLLTAASIPASAYDVTHANYTRLTYTYKGAGAGYCWGTAEQQEALPKFTQSFLAPAIAVRPAFVPGHFADTHMFCTLDNKIITKELLKDPEKARYARQQIDKLSPRSQSGRTYGLKLETEWVPKNSPLSSFGLRLMSSYNLNYDLYSHMYFDEDSFTLDLHTSEYSGRIYFDDLYIAGMRLSSSDIFTTFSEPVITWDRYEPMVYVDFHGTLPNSQFPVYEGGYEKIMTRKEFEHYFNELRPNGVYDPRYELFDVNLLTDLTVTYNCGNEGVYRTNDFSMRVEVPYLLCCD